ncbi:MAG: hypothetical protein AAFX55_07550 [Bacteroidota bacterium]
MEFTIVAKNEEEIIERIQNVKILFDADIDYILFWAVLHNIGNGPTRRRPEDWKSLDVIEWVEFYRNYKIVVSERQIRLIFEYVNRYFPGILQLNSDGKYKAILRNNISEADNIFTLERIAFTSLSI